MTISAFSIVKNEVDFIGFGLMSILPYVDEVCYADGNSTDGTLKLLSHIKEKYAGDKLKVFEGMDCADLKNDYVRLFNELMGKCKGGYLWYVHPDMILTKAGQLGVTPKVKMERLAYSVNMRSFAGEDLNLEIVKGRTNKWKTIMKNDFGLHYWGVYGHQNEDMYFKDITGNEHIVYKDMGRYPFPVNDSGVEFWHFCECKPRNRREEKMKNVFSATGILDVSARAPGMRSDVHEFDVIMNHPRVHLQNQSGGMFGDFEFRPRVDPLPEVFSKYKEEFDAVLKS